MHAHSSGTKSFSQKLADETGIAINRCYQCGKCSAGCPMSSEMDMPPSVVLRHLQTNNEMLVQKAIQSYSIWLCLSCETCLCRCPMEIETAKVMDYLRAEAIRTKQVNPKARKIVAFHKAFLSSVKKNGRLYEIGLIFKYKLASGEFLKDMVLAPGMFLKGKLHLFPERIKRTAQLQNIAAKSVKH
ncbi:MAG: 4Fe-4S dicluster domain-containing protein [Breznakibacter sp.]